METPEQIVESAIKDFKSTLDDRKLDQFSGTTITQVKKRIVASQVSHETFKTIIGLNRLKSFLDAWQAFDNTCRALHLGPPQLSGFIWGPLDWFLRVWIILPRNTIYLNARLANCFGILGSRRGSENT